jgi:predicted metal-dependent enzyme (double-stranded beta helix superfamily)
MVEASRIAMKHLIFLALLTASATPASAAENNYDAVVAAPGSHRVLMEDSAVRVLRVEVAPGATEPIHDHRWPSLMYFEKPQPITYVEYKLVDGHPVETRRVEAPALSPTQTVRGEPEGLHAVINRGTAVFVAVRVESKAADPSQAR